MAQEVQHVEGDKKKWSKAEFKQWLKDHEFKSELEPDDTKPNFWVSVAEFPSTQCKEGSFKNLTETTPDGIHLVSCDRLKSGGTAVATDLLAQEYSASFFRKGARPVPVGQAPNILQVKYPHILRTALGSVWAILPEKLNAIMEFLQLKVAGGDVPDEQIGALVAAQRKAIVGQAGIMVLPLFGLIEHRAGSLLSEHSGATSTERFAQRFRQALADPNISGIVIDIDSPGGVVNGVDELSAEIHAARGVKPIVAVANSLMASAAYWIGSAAGEVVAIPTGEVGSIGVVSVHTEMSKRDEQLGVKRTIISAGKHKTEINPFEPLSDEARDHIQERVDDFFGMFTRRVARNRGKSVKDVVNGFGQGRLVGAKEALAEGMIDRIHTIEQVFHRMGRAKAWEVPGEFIAERKLDVRQLNEALEKRGIDLLRKRLDLADPVGR